MILKSISSNQLSEISKLFNHSVMGKAMGPLRPHSLHIRTIEYTPKCMYPMHPQWCG
uniref:Uncharacterized protein n=1 Tax=Arundo donax TaxID=35708 RepID=A0A0A9BMV1_ARUDO